MASIPQTAQDWLTVALDPYHDTNVALEGLPDHTTGRSYVRVHNQARTVSANADGDNFSIVFTGFHGCAGSSYVEPYYCLDDVGTMAVGSFFILTSAANTEPNLFRYRCNAATNLGTFGTCFEGKVPSRLIGVAVEVHDTTAKLYQKGTITAVHCSGNFSHFDVVRSVRPAAVGGEIPPYGNDFLIERQDSAPSLPGELAMMAQYPGVYTGASSKGIYIVGRMSKAKHPTRFIGLPDIDATGDSSDYRLSRGCPHAFRLTETRVHTVSSPQYDAYQRASSGADGSWMNVLNDCPGLVNSGFQPFVIRISGAPPEGEYRVTFRTIIEYFPEGDDLTNLGIASPSPPVCNAALEAYQKAISVAPTAVPVNMNAAGDYWRIIKSLLVKSAPHALRVASNFVPAEYGMAMKLAGMAISKVSQSKSKQQPKKKKKITVPKRRGPMLRNR